MEKPQRRREERRPLHLVDPALLSVLIKGVFKRRSNGSFIQLPELYKRTIANPTQSTDFFDTEAQSDFINFLCQDFRYQFFILSQIEGRSKEAKNIQVVGSSTE